MGARFVVGVEVQGRGERGGEEIRKVPDRIEREDGNGCVMIKEVCVCANTHVHVNGC